jgi:predicted negative regulator of RcsB-dependent stress response
MEVYLSEEERVEALKKWWKDNARSVIVGIAMGAAVMYGWNAWQTSQRNKAEEAAGLYQNLLTAVENKQTEPARQLSQRLIDQHQGSVYATYGALFQARLQVEAHDLAGAKKTLQDLLRTVRDDNVKHLVRIRLGSVLMALGEHEEALRMIEPLAGDRLGEFERLYEALKGDLYANLNRQEDARLAYEKAKRLGDDSPLLQLKLDNLAVETAQSIR